MKPQYLALADELAQLEQVSDDIHEPGPFLLQRKGAWNGSEQLLEYHKHMQIDTVYRGNKETRGKQ
jgi:hypothetical protein